MLGGGNSSPQPQGYGEQYEDVKPSPRHDSGRSSRLGSFIEDEPTFESQGSSDSDSEVLPERPAKLPVSVVWQNISVVRPSRTSAHTKPAVVSPGECSVSSPWTKRLSFTGRCWLYLYTS